MIDNIVQAIELSRLYGEVRALNGVDLEVSRGEWVSVMGPSGSGKTTLLNILGGLDRPTSGQLRMDGTDVSGLSPKELVRFRREAVGLVFQQFHLVKGISVLENVMLPAYPEGEKYSLLKKRAMHLLDIFDISRKARDRVEWLSGGEAQRVTIARALMNNPFIVIADEPTSHLDTKLSRELMGIMGKLKEDNRTVLIASHDPVVYESGAVDRVIRIADGKIEEHG